MRGSDKIEMTIDISGELIKIGDVEFDGQNEVREAERSVKSYIEQLKKKWPDNSDRNILAMTAYQFAKWYHQLLKIQEDAMKISNSKIKQIEDLENLEQSNTSNIFSV